MEFYGDEHMVISESYIDIAALYSLSGEYEQALSFYYQALGVQKKKLAGKHVKMVVIYLGILNVLFSQKKYELALEVMNECEELMNLAN